MAIVRDVVLGVVVGALLAAFLYVVWGLLGSAVMATAGGTSPTSLTCGGSREFQIYASLGARVALGVIVAITATAGIFAVIWAVRLVKSRRAVLAISLLLAVFFGMVPATMCDYSILYTKC